MKHITRLVGLGWLLAAASVWSVRAQVPNGGFEQWTDACTIVDWANSSVCGVMAPITKSTVAHSGSFAVRGEVVSLFGQSIPPVLQSGTYATGFPITQRYESVDGFYKFAPVGGDRFVVNVVFEKDDSVVAQGASVFPAVAAYTAFSVKMVYQTAEVPDKATIDIQVFGPVTGPDIHVGSVMFVDDLTFGSGGGTAPQLKIVRSGSSVVVSWPADAVGYKLQRNLTLSPTGWADVPGLTAADRSYSFAPTAQGYFRLVK